jgi:hypothetical protein
MTNYPNTMTNQQVANHIARSIDGDEIDAIDTMLKELEGAGWTYEKPEGYFGAVVDSRGERHLLWTAQSFADAVVVAYRLLGQYRELGWA